MTRFSSIVLAATALAAGLGTTAPAFAAAHGSDGYHWEYTPGPRGTAHRVADRPAKPVETAVIKGHWRWNAGPRGGVTWAPTVTDRRMVPVGQMADMKATPEKAASAS